jgi:hypothetical protein
MFLGSIQQIRTLILEMLLPQSNFEGRGYLFLCYMIPLKYAETNILRQRINFLLVLLHLPGTREQTTARRGASIPNSQEAHAVWSALEVTAAVKY